MLFIRNKDEPGLIGALGSILGQAEVNVASFNLGRQKSGGKAIAILAVDGQVSKETIEKIRALPLIDRAKLLKF